MQHANGALRPLDLETLPDDYLPRTNYRPMEDRAEYARRTPRVSWTEAETLTLPWDQLTVEEQAEHASQKGQAVAVQRWRQKRVTEYFRLSHRTMLSQSRRANTDSDAHATRCRTYPYVCILQRFKSAAQLVDGC